ncbi:hypothetical protein ACIPRI_26485, partial [Variovorax sp. LARHSF232]
MDRAVWFRHCFGGWGWGWGWGWGGAAGVCRGGLMVRRSMLRIDSAAMLAQGAASRNSLRAPSVRC